MYILIFCIIFVNFNKLLATHIILFESVTQLMRTNKIEINIKRGAIYIIVVYLHLKYELKVIFQKVDLFFEL